GEDAAILCAGFKGTFALDDAYCAGRIVQELGAERSDAAIAAELVAHAFPDAHAGLTARTYGPPGLEEDIRFCARESVLDVLPPEPAGHRARRHVDARLGAVAAGLPRAFGRRDAAADVELRRGLAEVPDVAAAVLRVPVGRSLLELAGQEEPVPHDDARSALD